MATVVAEMSMSLDGFIALPDDTVGPLFDWYDTGPVEIPTAMPGLTFKVSEASAEHLHTTMSALRAIISGRRLFDVAHGWGGRHPLDVPVVVVTHSVPDGWPREDAPFTFVTEGVEKAVAEASRIAGDGMIGVSGPNIVQQCLNLGLLDEVYINLVPVFLGAGIPYFANLEDMPKLLDNPRVIQGNRVTHLYYKVKNR